MALSIDDIVELYRSAGAARYGMEAVNQEQHALQCAHLAQRCGSPPALVVAALLHDLGHLVTPEQPRGGNNDLHEQVAVEYLRGVFPDAVIEPIRRHVDAKRFLCAVEPGYAATLSPASVRSLQLQGGPFTAEQADRFIAEAFAADAVALRRWDDRAKDPALTPPGWAHYRAVLCSVSITSATR